MGDEESITFVSVIVPVHNSGDHLRKMLAGLNGSTRLPDEILVVDDGSSQDLQPIVQDTGATLHRLGAQPVGPAAARNRGVRLSRGDLLVFIDADVVVHPDTLERFIQRFEADPQLAAAFGSYDDHPTDPGLVSRYKNLVHHFVHQHANREASTFWAGCGAIRREAFDAVGGFSTQYHRPAIEDIHLGLQLRQHNKRILACPDIQATHLKRWSLVNLIRTDVFARAVPWSRLICDGRSLPDDLNINRESRAAAALILALIIMSLASLLALFWPYLGLAAAVSTVVLLAILLVMHRSLLCLFYHRGGIRLVLAGFALHLLYYTYSSITFTIIWLICAHSKPATDRSSDMCDI